MRARTWWTTAAVLGAAALGSSVAEAAGPTLPPPDVQGVRIDQLQLASPESAFFRAEGPHSPAAEGVEFAASATLEYGLNPLREIGVDTSGNKETLATLVQHELLARISGSITPLHWLSFDLSIPFALAEVGQAGKSWGGKEPGPLSVAGIGDLRIGTHFRPIDTKTFGLILGGRFWAPFGSEGAYLSDRSFRAEIDLAAAGELSRILYGCTFNIAPGFFAKRDGDRLAAGCALHVKTGDTVSVGLEPSFEVVTRRPTTTDAAQMSVLFEPLGAVRLRFGGVRVGVAAGPDLGGAPGTANLRALVSVGYVGLGKPPKVVPTGPPDRDLDKIPDSEDACPDEAGPPSRDPKLNGCPARDRDGDGIRDDEDFCPDRPGIPYPDPRANGCPDSDNDGLPDPIDQCVNEPGPPPTGCPKFARLGSGGFKIEPGIEFGLADKLSADGRAALEEVAATMRANPKLEQVSIAVGTKGVKPALSDKRAQEILLVLRASNLDSNRYEVVLRDDLRAGMVQVRLVK